MKHYVLDVESIGLHGEGFAWALASIDTDSRMLTAEGRAHCSPDAAAGYPEGRTWVAEHVPPFEPTHETPRAIRTAFWEIWLPIMREHGNMVLWADCGWPVEARFLAACIDDAPAERGWNGPFPLQEVATVTLLAGITDASSDPLTFGLQEHDPMYDACRSAGLLLVALTHLKRGERPA